MRSTEYRSLVLGAMLVAVVLACPGGLTGGAVGVVRRVREKIRGGEGGSGIDRRRDS